MPSGVCARERAPTARRAAPTAPRGPPPRAAAAPTARRAGRRAAAPGAPIAQARRGAGAGMSRDRERARERSPERALRRRSRRRAGDGDRGAERLRSAGELRPLAARAAHARSACARRSRRRRRGRDRLVEGAGDRRLAGQPPDPGGVARLHRVDGQRRGEVGARAGCGAPGPCRRRPRGPRRPPPCAGTRSEPSVAPPKSKCGRLIALEPSTSRKARTWARSWPPTVSRLVA